MSPVDVMAWAMAVTACAAAFAVACFAFLEVVGAARRYFK